MGSPCPNATISLSPLLPAIPARALYHQSTGRLCKRTIYGIILLISKAHHHNLLADHSISALMPLRQSRCLGSIQPNALLISGDRLQLAKGDYSLISAYIILAHGSVSNCARVIVSEQEFMTSPSPRCSANSTSLPTSGRPPPSPAGAVISLLTPAIFQLLLEDFGTSNTTRAALAWPTNQQNPGIGSPFGTSSSTSISTQFSPSPTLWMPLSFVPPLSRRMSIPHAACGLGYGEGNGEGNGEGRSIPNKEYR